MINDFLRFHSIPYPPHLDGWVELEHARILRFKGPVTSATVPKIVEFREQMYKAGLPVKNVIFDGAKITAVDSSPIAVLLAEMHKKKQKIGLINPPKDLRSYLEILHQQNKVRIFSSEQEAVDALNKKEGAADYLPAMTNTLKRNRSLSLLVALILFLITLPFFETNMAGVIYLLFFTFVLLAGIYAVSSSISHVAGGVLLATPTFVTAWSNIFIHDPKIVNAEMVFLTIFLLYTIGVILQHILTVKRVTANELFGAMSVYIMIGMTFGVIYALLESLIPGSLGFPPEEKIPTMTSFYYFSFVSMNSTGFSGITAISSLARAIVIVQVIIGVMYISTLIGKLVSANTSKEDEVRHALEAKLRFDVWSQDLAENFFRQKKLLLILSMAMVNYSISVLMTVLNLPIFLDSSGTSLAVILGGLPAGIFSGVIYNLIMAWTFWEPSAWVWMFCNIVVAVLTSIFVRAGWIDLRRPVKLLSAGMICGILNSGVVAMITYAANLPTYQGTMAVYRFFLKMTGSSAFSSIAEKMTVEIADKVLALLLAAVATIFIRELFIQRKNEETALAAS